ncbi:MAG: arginine deiminase-related protein [Fimbriimonadaceae bacterium]
MRQTTGTVLMVRPDGFGFDLCTEEDNSFQSRVTGDVADEAGREFGSMVSALEAKGVTVEVRPAPEGCPSAVFPNNWLSTHEDGSLFLYPMRAASRRGERSPETVAWLRERWPNVVDLSGFEAEGEFLEGTGSLVLDRAGGNAFVSRSPRSHERLVELWCEQTGFRPVVFDAVAPDGQAVYHTNVVLALGTGWAVACLSAVPNGQRTLLQKIIETTGRELVEVTWSQLEAMACNLLELDGSAGPLIVGGEAAFLSLEGSQVRALEQHCELLPVRIPTIERVGGGGARCAIAELFLP